MIGSQPPFMKESTTGKRPLLIPPSIDHRRAGLAYQHAYDWLASRLATANGKVTCATSAEQHTVEMSWRLPTVSFLPTSPGAKAVNRELFRPPFAAIGWVMPSHAQAVTLNHLATGLRPGGKLHIVCAGLLVAQLAEYREAKESPAYMRDVQMHVDGFRAGLKTEEWIGIQGMGAFSWRLVGRLLGYAARPDWHDRYYFGMRRQLLEARWLRPFVALTCLTLERPA